MKVVCEQGTGSDTQLQMLKKQINISGAGQNRMQYTTRSTYFGVPLVHDSLHIFEKSDIFKICTLF